MAPTRPPAADGPVDHASTVAALLADCGLLDALTTAMARRDDEGRAEADALAASIALPDQTTPEPKGTH